MKKTAAFLLSIFCLMSVAVSAQNYYEVKNFTGVTTSETIKAEITIGKTFSVELKGQEEAITDLVVELRGKMLVIRPKLNWKSWQRTYPDANVVAQITMPEIHTLICSGSGGMNVHGVNKTTSLTLTISGSAKLNLQNESERTTLIISGRGECDLKGKSNQMQIRLSGSGNVKATDYVVQDLNVIMSGSGKIYTYTHNAIKATISGAGMLYYKGGAEVRYTTLSGSGGVKAIEDMEL